MIDCEKCMYRKNGDCGYGKNGCGFVPKTGDLISREAAIDSIYKNHMNGKEGVKQDLENLCGSAVCFSETLQDAVESIEELPTVPAILIPDNATNGDMIKTLFADNFTINEYLNDTRGLIGEVHLCHGRDLLVQFDKGWWNAPYKAEKEYKA